MKQIFPFGSAPVVAAMIFLMAALCPAQQSLTWDQVKARFEASNPALKADADTVDEMRAAEVTANLRPNPQLTVSTDGTQIIPHDGVWAPFKGTFEQPNVSYLHERDHKRELRLQSAKEGTRMTEAQHEDLKRNLEFTLRAAFVQTLEAKAVFEFAKADLDYYDHIIEISRARFKAGDIAQIDLDRIELLRVQYESEMQTAIVNLRTSKIQLLQLMNDRSPVQQFDVTGVLTFQTLCSLWTIFAKRLGVHGPICRRRCRPFNSRKPTTNWRLPTDPPIQRSAAGTPTTHRATIPMVFRLSAPA